MKLPRYSSLKKNRDYLKHYYC